MLYISSLDFCHVSNYCINIDIHCSGCLAECITSIILWNLACVESPYGALNAHRNVRFVVRQMCTHIYIVVSYPLTSFTQTYRLLNDHLHIHLHIS